MTEVNSALRRKMGKIVGHDEIPIGYWKYLGEVGVGWLTNLFYKIFTINKMPSEWGKITLIHKYKN